MKDNLKSLQRARKSGGAIFETLVDIPQSDGRALKKKFGDLTSRDLLSLADHHNSEANKASETAKLLLARSKVLEES